MSEQKHSIIDRTGAALYKHQPFRWLFEQIFKAQLLYSCWRIKRNIFGMVKENFRDLYLDWKGEVLALAASGKLASDEELHDAIKSSVDAYFGEIIHPQEEFDMGEIVLGSKVTIKECHSWPELVGKTAVVRALLLVDADNKYPMFVKLDEPIIQTMQGPVPGMTIGMPWVGPHYCRPEELELVGETNPATVPDAFNKAFKDEQKPPETGEEAKP